ncbi:MAG: 2-oxo acid dehydrogenase subunit E2, partial [Flavobacteriaceae bacterium]
MAEIINMPRLSDTMEEGTVAKWNFKVGDKISEGDILAEIETDKATMEFESFYEGTLLHIGVQEGETVPVDVLLAIIGDKKEDISEFIKGNNPTEEKEDVVLNETVTERSRSDEAKEDKSQSIKIPEGVEVITMPRLSDTMEEGTVATWNKKIGDTVEEGDILAEIETDKATMEFESFYTGELLAIGVQEGETALVDTILAIVGPKGTDISGIMESYKAVSNTSEKEAPKKEAPTVVNVIAEQNAVTERSRSEVERPTPTKTPEGGRIFISPLAKKLADEKGINLSQVSGSGENGRIIKRDIENYQPISGGVAQTYTPVGEESFEEVKNSQMRKVIAKRLGESKFTAPHYYLTIELDMDNAIASRVAINSDPDVKVSFNDMIVKACAMALQKHPKVNSHWTDASTLIAKHIHIGVAVAVD